MSLRASAFGASFVCQQTSYGALNGFRLHETAMYLERQTQFGDIPWPREGSAGVFLDSAQSVADRVRVAKQYLSRTVHRRISVLPYPKRFEQCLALLVGKVGEMVQSSADRLDHRLWGADCRGGQDGAVEHRDRGCGGIGRAVQHQSGHVQGLWRIAQIP